ncbi:hypothetical protein HanPI659440_Chr13g0481961 [Helianthus annuus]|nr:hypothetical protein HanPI659440_Chr13g0481961 [Helianthus annuus]
MVKICIGKECTYTRTRRMRTCKMIKICIGRGCTYTRTRIMQISLLTGRFCKTSNLRTKSNIKVKQSLNAYWGGCNNNDFGKTPG